MNKFDKIIEFINKDFFMSKDLKKLKKKDIEEFKYLVENLPDDVDHEYAFNFWIMGEGKKFQLTNPKLMNRVSLFLVCYLNRTYREKK